MSKTVVLFSKKSIESNSNQQLPKKPAPAASPLNKESELRKKIEAVRAIVESSTAASTQKKASGNTKKDKKKSKGKAEEQAPPKKRGRPSKAEVAAREAAKLEADRKKKEELKSLQQVLLSEEVQASALQDSSIKKVIDSGFVPTYQLFQVGDRVKHVGREYVSELALVEGTVTRHDIDSAFVSVAWDDGAKFFSHASTLEKIDPERNKKKGKRRGRKPKGDK